MPEKMNIRIDPEALTFMVDAGYLVMCVNCGGYDRPRRTQDGRCGNCQPKEAPIPETPEMTEGWGVLTPRKAHYYRKGEALCGRRGFYRGPLEADDKPSPDDCAECRRKRNKEASND